MIPIKKSPVFLVTTVILLWVIYVISPAFPPFVCAVILSYICVPMMHRLEKRGISENIASIIVVLTTISFILIVFYALIPVFFSQIIKLVDLIQSYQGEISKRLNDAFNVLSQHPALKAKIIASVEDALSSIWNYNQILIQPIIFSGNFLMELATMIVMIPVIMFYTLKNHDHFPEFISSLIGKQYKSSFKVIMKDLDRGLSGYLRGQTLVSMLLSAYYVGALYTVGLSSSLVIGVLSGFMSFIPYVGAIVSFTIMLLTAVLQFSGGTKTFIIFSVFVLGQLLELIVLTPRIIQEESDLHPLGLLLGLLSGYYLFGFWGVLLGVPLTVIVSVLLKHYINYYRKHIIA